MNDVMVSIRMPKSMASELKALLKQGHFLDLSEEIRSIVRKKWLSHTSPQLFELKKLREGIGQQLKEKSARKVHEEVAKELDKIKSQLEKGGFSK